MNMNELKGRVWAFVLYPDSCAYDYVDMIKKLDTLGIPLAVSPLHDPSKNVECENEKKIHYHCMFYLEGQKKQSDLKKLMDMSTTSYDRQYFNWDLLVDKNNIYGKKAKYPYFIKINSISAHFRYFLHLDSPLKQQFPDYKLNHFAVDDEQKYNTLILLNGFNERDYLKNGTSHPAIDLVNIVKENEIKSVAELTYYLSKSKNYTQMNYIEKHFSYVRDFLLRDLFWERKRSEK